MNSSDKWAASMTSTKRVAMNLEAKFVTRVKKLSLQFRASFFFGMEKLCANKNYCTIMENVWVKSIFVSEARKITGFYSTNTSYWLTLFSHKSYVC